MSGFNLISESWIPCVEGSGNRVRLGVRDVLRRSVELQEVSHPSPLVTVSIHRFLLALVHRTHGPRSDSDWIRLWKAKSWDWQRLDDYLMEWEFRFELLEGPHRFYQSDYASGIEPIPISKLAMERASGNNTTLFDHTPSEQPMSPDEAACYILAAQAFAIGGLVTPKTGIPSSKYASDSHLIRGAVALVRGQNLFETLLLNLCNYDISRGKPYPMNDRDRPAWETEPGPPRERQPRGWLDLLTWQSRRILLHSTGSQVTGVTLLKGDEVPEAWQPKDAELMVAYRKNPKATGSVEPYLPLRISDERALWRDSLSVFASAHGGQGLRMLQSLASRRELLATGRIFPIDMMGVSKDQAKPLLWRHERLALPSVFLKDSKESVACGEKLRIALESAESVGRILRQTMYLLANALVTAPGGSNPRAEESRAVMGGIYDEGQYWQRLEGPFTEFMYHLAHEESEAQAALKDWIGRVREAATGTFRGVVASLGESIPALKATSRVTPSFYSKLKKVGGAVP